MAVKTWLGNVSTWATAAQWSPSGVPASTDDVYINAGTCTVAGQTCNSLNIGNSCTIAGTTLTITSSFNITGGLFSPTLTQFNITGGLNNSGGSIAQSLTSATVFAFTGANSASVNFGASNNIRQLTIAKTGGTLTLTGNQINCQATNSNTSNFTFTSGTLVQNVVILCGAVTNTSATARFWQMNQDVIVSAGGNAASVSMNSTTACTFTSRTGTVRIRGRNDGTASLISFSAATPSATAAAAYTINVALESNTNWSISGSVNNLYIDQGSHTGTAANLNIYGTLTTSGTKTFTTLNPTIYSYNTGQTVTINAGDTTFGTVTIAAVSGVVSSTFNVNSIKGTSINCTAASCTYNLGVKDDNSQLAQISGSSGGVSCSGASSTYNLYNVRGYALALSATSGTYNCYDYQHNLATNPPTTGTANLTAGTLTMKSGYKLITHSFTSTTGTRGLTFEDNSWISSSGTGAISYQYGPNFTCSTAQTNSCGFVHNGSGAWQADFATSAPAQNNTFNFYWSKIVALTGTGVFYVRTLGNMVDGSAGRYTTNYDTFDTGWGLGGGAFTNTTARSIIVYKDVLLTGDPFNGATGARTQWYVLNLTLGSTDGRTQFFATTVDWYNGGSRIDRLGTITMPSAFTGTLRVGYLKTRNDASTIDDGNGELRCTNFAHNNGVLDLRGRQLYIETQYNHGGDITNIKSITTSITPTRSTYADPGIWINATTGTPWNCPYTDILYSNWKVWVKIRGGTVNNGGTISNTDRQPSFDLSERAAAYTITGNILCVGSLRINNYTVPTTSTWSIGGPEFTVQTGGLSAPADFSVYIRDSAQYDNTNAKGYTQFLCDNTSFVWPLVITTTTVNLVRDTWFKNLILNTGTTLTSGNAYPFNYHVCTGLLSGTGGSGTTLSMGSGTWEFQGMTAGGTGSNQSGIWAGDLSTDNFRVTANSDATLKFTGTNGTGGGDFAECYLGFSTYGGKLEQNLPYNSGTGTGDFYLYMVGANDTTTVNFSQIDFGYTTAILRSISTYGINIKGSTFNIGTNKTLRGSTSAGVPSFKNVESNTYVSGDYLSLTYSRVSGGQGWYAGANTSNNGSNSGWTFSAPTTYTLGRSAASRDEGYGLIIDLATNLANGSQVPYTITGVSSADINGASLTGNFTVASGSDLLGLTITQDYLTEGTETLTLSLDNGAASISVTINDTSLTPTYSLSRSVASVNEGQSFTITLNTTNLADGTTVPYTITGVSSSDINGASLTGSFTVSGNTASLVVDTTWDYVTEGTETFTLTITPAYGTGSAISVAINNVLHPSYALAASPTSLNEGGNFTVTLTTTDVADNTSIPYTITGVSSADINGASLTGNFTVVSGTASLVVTTSADYLTEGDETFVLTLNSIGTNVSVLIADYYKTRTYSLGTSASTVTEGNSFTVTLNTTNVFDGTTVPYTISGTGITTADINGASLTGNFTVSSNTATQNFAVTLDNVGEGDETFTLTLGSPASGSINVTIKDPVTGTGGSFISLFED
jgi:hypothetical protein